MQLSYQRRGRGWGGEFAIKIGATRSVVHLEACVEFDRIARREMKAVEEAPGS